MKLIDRKNTNELIQMLSGSALIKRMVRVAVLMSYGHVLSKEEGDI